VKYHRRSIRLKGFDYANNGFYFITICVQDKLKLFWDINEKRADTSVRPYIKSNQTIHPSDKIGSMIDYWLNEIPNHFENVAMDKYIVMPDHIHFILIINNYFGRTHRSARTSNQLNKIVGVDRCVDPFGIEIVNPNENKETLGNVIQWFKTMSTNEYIKNVKQHNWPKFNKRLWQRNYFERIIRNEKEYLGFKKYIEDNPRKYSFV